MKKKVLFITRTSKLVLALVIICLFTTCIQQLNLKEIEDKTNQESEYVTISLSSTMDMARTIGYELPEIGHYELFGRIVNSDNPIKSLGDWVSLESATVSLQSEIWNFKLIAYDTNENSNIILEGIQTQIDLSVSTSISFSLKTIESGTGVVTISLSWPISQAVSSCSVCFGNEETKFLTPISNDTITTISYSNLQAATGDKWIVFILRDTSNNIMAYVKELVRVRQCLTSSAQLSLSSCDFNNVPNNPSEVTSCYLSTSQDGTQNFLLSWKDTSLVETGFDISLDEGLTVYSSVDAGITETTISNLPVKDSYSFSVSSKNLMGNSHYITTTNSKHSLSFNANGGIGAVMTPLTAFKGQVLTLPLNSYTHSESIYSFNSWRCSDDNSEVYVDDGGTYIMGGCDVILYAQWTLRQGISAVVSNPDDSTEITCISNTDNFTVIKGNSITFSVNEEFSSYEWSSYTNSGSTLHLGSDSSATLNTSELAIGPYFVTVKVTDQNGFSYSTTVKIIIQSVDSNPTSVSNLTAFYSVVEEKILVNWIDSVDTDLKDIVITCAKNGDEEQIQTIDAGIQVCEFTQIIKDDSEYTITAVAQDLGNNVSEEKTLTVFAANYAYINSISLDKSHFDPEMENRTITATLNGANLSEIDSIKVKMTEGSDTTLKTASIVSSSKAIVSFEAPIELANYSVKCILNNTSIDDVFAEFSVTQPANFTAISLALTQFQSGITDRTVQASIVGSNLDIRKYTVLKVVDTNGTIITTHEVSLVSNSQLTATVDVPLNEGDYYVQCWTNDTCIDFVDSEGRICNSAVLQIYGTPSICSMYIPPQKLGDEGNPIPVYIKGANLNIGDEANIVVSPGNISATILGEKSAIAYICEYSDCEVTATLNTIQVDNVSANLTYYKYDDFTKQLVFIPSCMIESQQQLPVETNIVIGNSDMPIIINPFLIGNCEVTYALWYEVYQWAITHMYMFANPGCEGNDGVAGASPLESDRYQPVSTINWRDAIVWCNAYSEYTEKSPVYYSDSSFSELWRNSESSLDDAEDIENSVYVNSEANGFRLPTQIEWEYAARGANLVGATWNYDYAGSQTCKDVAWYETNSDDDTGVNETKNVASLCANDIGLYDMSGNIREWIFSASSDTSSQRIQCGGNFNSSAGACKLTEYNIISPDKVYYYYGFRVACSVDD